jgi:HJR/Mrr/RecB family endonuclease
VDTASVADIVLITNRLTLFNVMKERQWMEQLDEKPILFVTDYRLLKYSLDIVGAFYWRKGRSQLLFIKDRLTQYHISLPQEYHAFMVDTL